MKSKLIKNSIAIIIILQLLIVSVSLGQNEEETELSSGESLVVSEDEAEASPLSSEENSEALVPTNEPQSYNMDVPTRPPSSTWLIPFIVLAIPFAFCIWTANRSPTSGIAGWLLLPAIGLVISPIISVLSILNFYEILPKADAKYVDALNFAIMKNAIMFCFYFYVAVLFFYKKHKAPRMYIILLLTNLGLSLITLIQGGGYFLKPVIFSLLQACIWIPYLNTSKRVIATFGTEDEKMLSKLPKL